MPDRSRRLRLILVLLVAFVVVGRRSQPKHVGQLSSLWFQPSQLSLARGSPVPVDSLARAFGDLHLRLMARAWIQVARWKEAKDLAIARQRFVPHADDRVISSCFPDDGELRDDFACSLCNEARDRWLRLNSNDAPAAQ
jgi:hypothetical protein